MPAMIDSLPMLVIDTASQHTWVGLLGDDQSWHWETSSDEASHALFACLKKLDERPLDWRTCRSIAYNEGPGSMLGIRSALMAIRTWIDGGVFSPSTVLMAYNSLALASLLPGAQKAEVIITDARRKSWNAYEPQETIPKIALLENEALESRTGEIRILKEFNQWTQTTAKLIPLPYDPPAAFASPAALDLLRTVDIPTPLVLRESEYQKWVPRFSTTERATP